MPTSLWNCGQLLDKLHHYVLPNVAVNTLRPRQHGRHFADDTFKCIFLNENVWIPIEISLKFVPKGSINNNPALFQIMAWRRPGEKPLSEPMMVSSLTHICVTRPQWVNWFAWTIQQTEGLLSGVPDYFGRNKISSGGDLSHYSSASLY